MREYLWPPDSSTCFYTVYIIVLLLLLLYVWVCEYERACGIKIICLALQIINHFMQNISTVYVKEYIIF